ncbi:MAG: ADP-ribosylglycohydrolase [Tenericutes bacterium ADurb.Bin239]|nr:MAG: ADP-ribosylglycohydrolase [Tenericutes bacterium ADurb.Bin239]
MHSRRYIQILEKYVSQDQIQKYIGCLIGGAVGDALGYPVEFFSLDEIKAKYGEQGIQHYDLNNGVAEVSDDTQMTLFTASGYLLGAVRWIYAEYGLGAHHSYCRKSYEDWLLTQTRKSMPKGDTRVSSWLMAIPELYHRRAPGQTCLAFNNECNIDHPNNDSKGCGGVMRVAPVGLIYPVFFETEDTKGSHVIYEAAQCAALTHGHELGYIPAGCFAQIINLASHTDMKLDDIIERSLEDTAIHFSHCQEFPYFLDMMQKAIDLSMSADSDEICIAKIGEGWVAEEALAIAVYCALRHQDDFVAGIRAAVNHDGDSDSTGSITGNILGAYLGLKSIPEAFLKELELRDVIIEIALDLATEKNASKIYEELNLEDNFLHKYQIRALDDFIHLRQKNNQ